MPIQSKSQHFGGIGVVTGQFRQLHCPSYCRPPLLISSHEIKKSQKNEKNVESSDYINDIIDMFISVSIIYYERNGF